MTVGARLATRSDIKDTKAASVLESPAGRKVLFAALALAQRAAMSALKEKFAALRWAVQQQIAGACRHQTAGEEAAIMQDYALRLAAVVVTTPRDLVAAAIQSLIAQRTAALAELRNRARLREAAQMRFALGQLGAHAQDERRGLARAFAQSRDALRETRTCRPRRARLLTHFHQARAEVTGRAIVPAPIRPRASVPSRRIVHRPSLR